MIGRRLVTVLRHDLYYADLRVDLEGWTRVGHAAEYFSVDTSEMLRAIATESERLELSVDGARVRARYGHTRRDVAQQYTASTPPHVLFHGTATKSLDAIAASGGLRPLRRHFVHITTTYAHAREVGARHGAPAVFRVDATRMHAEGYDFYPASDKVWLTRAVPSRYLTLWRY